MSESEIRLPFSPSDIVRHFKHERHPDGLSMYACKILGYATHSETRETLVIYEALYE